MVLKRKKEKEKKNASTRICEGESSRQKGMLACLWGLQCLRSQSGRCYLHFVERQGLSYSKFAYCRKEESGLAGFSLVCELLSINLT